MGERVCYENASYYEDVESVDSGEPEGMVPSLFAAPSPSTEPQLSDQQPTAGKGSASKRYAIVITVAFGIIACTIAIFAGFTYPLFQRIYQLEKLNSELTDDLKSDYKDLKSNYVDLRDELNNNLIDGLTKSEQSWQTDINQVYNNIKGKL